MHTYEILDTPDGPFTVIENGDGAVVAAAWSDEVAAVAARAGLTAGPEAGPVPGRAGGRAASGHVMPGVHLAPGTCRASSAVHAFYAGDVGAPTRVPVESHGTEFQRAVWDALRQIPPGQVRRYGQVASTVGRPGASRAVGAACGRNPIALFVPCHRVVGAHGALTGFAWGVQVKRSVLGHEGVTLA